MSEKWTDKNTASLLAWISILASICAVGVGFGLVWALLFTAILAAGGAWAVWPD